MSFNIPAVRRAAAIIVTASLTVFAQSRLPRVPGATVVNVSTPPGTPSEPGIAINPNNPRQIVVVYQTTPGAAYSTDRGATFTIAQGVKPTDWRVVGDVSTTFDNKGNAYICYLAFDHLGTTDYWAHNAGRNGIFVRRSRDGGKTWDKHAIAVKAFPTGHEPGLQFEDEPRIFADNGATSPYVGALYVGWVEWQIDQSVMFFSRSTDAGQTWSAPLQISTHQGLPRDDNGSLGGFVAAIAPDGVIHAIWNDGNSIMLTQSRDGGKNFGKPKAVIETGPPYFGEVPGVSRVEGFAQIAVERHGNSEGNLYIAWSDYRNGDIDVFVSSSSDHGLKWSRPVRVNDDPIHDGNDQFYQWLAVDPVSGDVYLDFYDRRDDPQNRKTRMTLARSIDGGRSFKNYAWTDNAFQGQQVFLGDYTWITAYNRRVYAAWAEVAPQSQPPPEMPHGQSRGASPHGTSTIIRVGTADFSTLK